MLDKNSTETLSFQFPDIFSQIKSQTSGNIITSDYLFVFRKVEVNQQNYETPKMDYQLVENNQWYITMMTSRNNESLYEFQNRLDFLNHRFSDHLAGTLIILLFNIFTAYSSSYFIHNFLERRRNNLIDALSGAYQRDYGLKKAKKLYRESLEKNQDFGLIYIDLNDLKHVNDHHGHKAGDEMISILGDAIQSNIRTSKKGKLRENDLFVRMGGDEFIIALKNIKTSEMETIWSRIQVHLSNHKIDDHTLSASHGCMLVKAKDKRSFNEVLEKADALMYQEKQIFKKR